jgi:DNA-binding transcriptional MerR regulator
LNKSDHAFRTITEVAEILNLPAHVLRFWESKFKYIKPLKRGGGRRYYRPEDINLLKGIKLLLYSEGLTINGALKLIQSKGVKTIIKKGAEESYYKETLNQQIENKSKVIPISLITKIREEHHTLIKDIEPSKLRIVKQGLESLKSRITIRNNNIRLI